jgi:flavin reductase (DIM6/NTAB) family NADH-FMN oxidoreductase RutF
MLFDFSTLDETTKYKMMSNTIFPRPVAWICTENEEVLNLAPFSYFIPLSSEPPLVIVSIAHKENGEPKDTLANILKHKVCTINFAHKPLLDKLIDTAEALPKTLSETEHFNIATKPLLEGFPPMVADAKCALFCTFVKTIDLGARYEPVILEVKQAYIDDESVDENGHLMLDHIGRVGMEFLIDATRVVRL